MANNDKPRFIRKGGKIIPIGGKSKGGKKPKKNRYKQSAKEGAALGVGQSVTRSLAKKGKFRSAAAMGLASTVAGISKFVKDVRQSKSFGDFAKLTGAGLAGSAGSQAAIGASKMAARSMGKRGTPINKKNHSRMMNDIIKQRKKRSFGVASSI